MKCLIWTLLCCLLPAGPGYSQDLDLSAFGSAPAAVTEVALGEAVDLQAFGAEPDVDLTAFAGAPEDPPLAPAAASGDLDAVLEVLDAHSERMDAMESRGVTAITALANEIASLKTALLPAKVSPEKPAPTATSQPTLRAQIAAYRRGGGQRYYQVQDGQMYATTREHLIQEHGWSGADLEGLTQQELDYLHGASHTGQLQPGKSDATVPAAQPPVLRGFEEGIQVSQGTDGNWHWEHPVLGSRYNDQLREGGNYAGLIYQQGRMWPTEQAWQQNRRWSSSVQNCPSGICPQP